MGLDEVPPVKAIRSVRSVEIALDRSTDIVILHDPGHSLDERILREQFGV
jgi:NAD+ kinase